MKLSGMLLIISWLKTHRKQTNALFFGIGTECFGNIEDSKPIALFPICPKYIFLEILDVVGL